LFAPFDLVWGKGKRAAGNLAKDYKTAFKCRYNGVLMLL